jgi:hypothetical protein
LVQAFRRHGAAGAGFAVVAAGRHLRQRCDIVMSQNLRVALWVPNADPAAIGNTIHTTSAPSIHKRILSEFAAGGGGGTGDVSEAPLDGKTYVRADGIWEPLDGGTF